MTGGEDARLFDLFMEVHRGLPRQGPGLDACTLQALDLCAGLPEAARVLDIGCGPGMQTMALARALPQCDFTAVDRIVMFLDQLRASAAACGLAERITAERQDMAALPYDAGRFDLIWAEGSAYIMGFAEALNAWKPLLTPGGYLAASELVWTTDTPPEEARAFLQTDYPGMGTVEGAVKAFENTGFEVAGHFLLPDRAWWAHYYTPLEQKLPELTERFRGDDMAGQVLDLTRREIALRRDHPDAYGYVFIVGRKPDRL